MSEGARSSGVDVDDLSPDIRPQDDLFLHANERWIERTPIPPDKSRYGTFDILFEQAEAAIRLIVDEARLAPVGSEARKVGDLYASFMDEDRVEARGAEPLGAPLQRVDEIASFSELLGAIGQGRREGLSGLFEVFVDNDPGNPERYLTFFEQGGLSLPDESYYRLEQFSDVRERFLAHVERMFTLSGVDDAATRAARVVELETEVAKRHWDKVTSRDSEKVYNLMTWAEAATLFRGAVAESAGEGVDLETWRAALGAPQGAFDEVVVREPSFVGQLGELFGAARLDAWKDWLAWQVVRDHAPYLSRAFVDEHFDFYGRTLTGTPQLRERWKRGVSLVEGALGESVGQIYVERYFPEDAKARMDELVANLVGAYRESITGLEWMGEETRQRALEKLRAFTPKIGYPVRWRDYGALSIDPDDLLANVHAAYAFEFDRQLAKIGQPIDRDEWLMTPQTVNAYYKPSLNEIVFPAAILQPPFFDKDRDDAANYGAIGAVIGHEIGHGFDDQGSKFDGTGRLTDWWQPSDRAAFEKRTAVLIDQYNALSPRTTPELHVNGALTIGENIGDLGGVGIAWKAYVRSLQGAAMPVIDGLTGAQRFFLSWARSWRDQERAEETERLLATDPHSPAEFRTNQIVRNIDEFYDAFGVSADDALWLDVTERVSIW